MKIIKSCNILFCQSREKRSLESTMAIATPIPKPHPPPPSSRLPHVNTVPPKSKPQVWFPYHPPSDIINHPFWFCPYTIVGTGFTMVSFVTGLVTGLPYRRYGFSPRTFRMGELCCKMLHRDGVCSDCFCPNSHNH